MPVNDVEDLVELYMTERGISKDTALREIREEVVNLAEGFPGRRRISPPPPAKVVARVAEVLPHLRFMPKFGGRFSKMDEAGMLEPWLWLPPGVMPVGFNRGYWVRDMFGYVALHRNGKLLKDWTTPTEIRTGEAITAAVAIVRQSTPLPAGVRTPPAPAYGRRR